MARLSEGNVVLQAEPGAGKSTVLPLSLLNAEWLKGKKIIMLEPRRVAAKTIAHYLARKLGEEVGQRVGYQVKNDRKISKDTILEIVTEGILTRRIQSNPEIDDIALIIFDEFHERSVHSDLSLMLALEVQQAIRDDLKLLVMSATIDTSMIADYMGGAAIINCSGRAYPVSLNYQSTGYVAASYKKQLANQILEALKYAFKHKTVGDVLVFLPGQADIHRCLSVCKDAAEKDVFMPMSTLLFLPLYGSLTLAQQEQALVPDPDGRRRVIFSTNIAETSLTIEGITCVIDSGLEKVLIYDPISSMTRLETQLISKASAEQRKGRAGRTQAGECIRLWDENKHSTLQPFQSEEILTVDLMGVLLELCLWGSGDYESINWLTPPPKSHYQSAVKNLILLGLMSTDKKLTPLGKRAMGLGLSPRLSAMLLQAEGRVEQEIACDLAALLSDRDIFGANNQADNKMNNQTNHQVNNSTDIIDRLLAVQAYKRDRKSALSSYPLKRPAIEQLLDNSLNYTRQLKLPLSEPSFSESSFSERSFSEMRRIVGKLMLYAYPDRLAKSRNSGGRYQLSNGRGAFLLENDSLVGSDWLVVADCDGQKKEGRIYRAIAISTQTVWACLADKVEEQETFSFDAVKKIIVGREVTKHGALILSSKPITSIPPEVFHDCLQDVLKRDCFELIHWTPQCEAFVARTQWLAGYIDGFPNLSKSHLIETLEDWLFPYLSNVHSIQALKKLNVFDLLLGILSWNDQQTLNKEAPVHYTTPSHKTLSILYDEQQGPTVSVQLQEMFGQLDSPRIGGNRVSIRFELLSPARRPIQTTSDLGNFWRTSYFEVAKEMRGKYPKHRWPDEPLLEAPGRSIKKKT